jgi:ABC-type transport system substrate-binding protein
MKRFALALLVASSLLLGTARAATRPRYGGTLRVSLRAAPTSLDPVDLVGAAESRNLPSLIFDTLVSLDDRGNPEPALAASWQAEPGSQRWQFTIRGGVTFHDGTALTADAVAASLRVANSGWRVFATGGIVIIERDSPAPELLSELALARNGVAKRGGGEIVGTGPFIVKQWIPGKPLMLAAFNEYWGGRPFLDSIEIDMGLGLREQALAFDLGKAGLVEVAPEQARPSATEAKRVQASAPTDLMALVFARDPQSPEEGRMREALALSIDRTALNNVLLQGTAEPAGGLLPGWMTGYSFLFPVNPDLAKARQVRGEIRRTAPWSLAYDVRDPLAPVVAERIALNAHDAGIELQLTNSANANLRLVYIPILSLDPRLALATLQSALALSQPKPNRNSPEDLHSVESMLLQSERVIPLLHLRSAFAMNPKLRNWSASPEGSWRLADVWLSDLR